MNKFKYKKICISIILLFLLTACQPTPDVAPVVNKSEGLPPDAIIEAVPEGEIKVIDAPGHWSETIERMEGHIKVAADTDVSVPQISNTPVIELKQYDFTEERLSELVSYFAGDARLYKEPKMTKAELENEIKNMENKSNGYEEYSTRRLSSMIKRAQKLLESAPDNVVYEYVEPAFTYPVQPDSDFLSMGKDDRPNEEYMFTAQTKIGARYPRIEATKYNSNAGTGSSFDYRVGSVVDEEDISKIREEVYDLENWDNGVSKDEKYIEYQKEWLVNSEEEIKTAWETDASVGLTPETAMLEAEKAFKELSIEGMGLHSLNKGCIELYAADNETRQIIPGYNLTFYRDLGGLIGYQQPGGTIYDDLPEQIYAPDFLQEKIEIFISEEGIENFIWLYMAEPVWTIAKNTKLLSFDTIKNKLADHFYYTLASAVDESGNPIFDTRFEIYNVELRSGYINAFEASQNVWLVPLWVFEFKEFRIDLATGHERYFARRVAMINAIDGGYVTITASRNNPFIYSDY